MDRTRIDDLYRRAHDDQDAVALEEFVALSAQIEAEGDRYALVRLRLSQAAHRALAGDIPGARALIDDALLQVDPDDTAGRLELLNVGAVLLLEEGRRAEGLGNVLLVAQADAEAYPRKTKQALGNVAFTLYALGDLDGAAHYARQLLDRDPSEAHAHWVLHDVARDQGDEASMRQAVADASAQLGHRGDTARSRTRAIVAMLRGHLARYEARPADALAHADDAERWFRRGHMAEETWILTELRADALAQRGQTDDALQAIEAVIDDPGMVPRWRWVLAERAAAVAERAGDPAMAGRWYRRALREATAERHSVGADLRRIVERHLRSQQSAHLELEATNHTLTRTLHALRLARQQLEVRVAERTESLRQTVAELEHEVRQRRSAEVAALSANKAKSTFLATMSHELRTPLTAIVGLAEMIRDDSDDAAVQRDASDILSASGHLMQVIDEVLDHARVESGQQVVTVAPTPLTHVLDEVATMAERLASNAGLRWSCVRPDDEVIARIDPLRYKQVLLNLIGNAVKFTDEGSITLTVERRGPMVRATVTDTGIGIPTTERDRIFQPFEQVDMSSTRRHDGSGLGLAISRHLVHAMQGTLALAELDGPGTAFVVEVPVARRR